MKTIGILGGLGPESTISYYRYITEMYYERYKDYAYPNIIISSPSFLEFIDAEYKLPEKIKDTIQNMQMAGADFVVAACNSVHVVYDEIASDIPIPWFSIMDAVAEQIKKENITRVGLLGTVFTMGGVFFQKTLAKHGITTITPSDDDQKKINEIIYSELIREVVKEDSRQFVLDCIDRLVDRGAEGIILGCTELPFLIKQKHTGIKIFDTTKIHSQKTLELALEEDIK
jgi:aspartate racemase